MSVTKIEKKKRNKDGKKEKLYRVGMKKTRMSWKINRNELKWKYKSQTKENYLCVSEFKSTKKSIGSAIKNGTFNFTVIFQLSYYFLIITFVVNESQFGIFSQYDKIQI